MMPGGHDCTRRAIARPPRSHPPASPHERDDVRIRRRLHSANASSAAFGVLLAAAVYKSAFLSGQCAEHVVVEARAVAWGARAEPEPGLVALLQLRGGGRRRVARPATRMKLGHLSKVVEKRASNIARRQQRDARQNAHYDKADGVWEIMNPQELKEFKNQMWSKHLKKPLKTALKQLFSIVVYLKLGPLEARKILTRNCFETFRCVPKIGFGSRCELQKGRF